MSFISPFIGVYDFSVVFTTGQSTINESFVLCFTIKFIIFISTCWEEVITFICHCIPELYLGFCLAESLHPCIRGGFINTIYKYPVTIVWVSKCKSCIRSINSCNSYHFRRVIFISLSGKFIYDIIQCFIGSSTY